jgi:hypothetical protein
MNFDDLNESQKKCVVFEGKHLLVLAGAGTGKTKTIIARSAYLISKGVNPSKIQITAALRSIERGTLNCFESDPPEADCGYLKADCCSCCALFSCSFL